jgi:catechol 2,3-dioxygenase-like lactoylglutathione lyase family enzyme
MSPVVDSPPPAEVALSRIGQIAVLVRDADRAVRFYRDTLGLRLLFQAPPALAFFDDERSSALMSEPRR